MQLWFREWLILQEEISFERNLEFILDDIPKFGGVTKEDIEKVKAVKPLVLQTIENKNTPEKRKNAFLDFLIGFVINKGNVLREDLEMAWDIYSFCIQNKDKLYKIYPEFKDYTPARQGWNWNLLFNFKREEEHKKAKGQVEKAKAEGQLLPGQKLEKVVDQNVTNTLGQNINYKIYKIPKLTEEEAKSKQKIDAQHALMCHLGKGTRWCTASPTGTYYQNYLLNDIYVVYRNNKPKYQLDVSNNAVQQFMDVNDVPVVGPDAAIGTYSKYVYRMLANLGFRHIDDPKERYAENDAIQKITYNDYDPGPQTDEMIFAHTDDYNNILKYAKMVGGRVSTRLEAVIAQNMNALLHYALEVIKGPLPLELSNKFLEFIKEDRGHNLDAPFGRWLLSYIELRKKWPELEDVMAKNAEHWYPGFLTFLISYALTIKERLQPELEKLFVNSPQMTLEYAKRIFKGPLPPEMEKAFFDYVIVHIKYLRGGVDQIMLEYAVFAKKRLPYELEVALGFDKADKRFKPNHAYQLHLANIGQKPYW